MRGQWRRTGRDKPEVEADLAGSLLFTPGGSAVAWVNDSVSLVVWSKPRWGTELHRVGGGKRGGNLAADSVLWRPEASKRRETGSARARLS